MSRQKRMGLVAAVVLTTAMVLLVAVGLVAVMPATTQVDKLAAKTTGISCGTCAAFSEEHLRLLPGIDDVIISAPNEIVMVTYKPSAVFDPSEIRDILATTEVGVVQFQISARGQVLEQGGKRFFVAGKDKFLLVESSTSPKLPAGTPAVIEGILNDLSTPMEIKVMTVKPAK